MSVQSKLDKVFFSGDHHFGHGNIIKFCNRPFAGSKEMDEEMIRRWNEIVPPDGEMFYVGDLSFHSRGLTLKILDQLNGRIHLILGNHDRKITGEVKDRFVWVKYYHEEDFLVNGKKKKFVMLHCPMRTWPKSHYGSYHVHGHCHGSLGPECTNRMDVGVDTNNFYPYTFQEVVDRISSYEQSI